MPKKPVKRVVPYQTVPGDGNGGVDSCVNPQILSTETVQTLSPLPPLPDDMAPGVIVHDAHGEKKGGKGEEEDEGGDDEKKEGKSEEEEEEDEGGDDEKKGGKSEEEEEEDKGGDDKQGDVVSASPFQLADEMQKGPSKVFASEIKLLVDVDKCAEILSLLTLHFRYLKKEICGCGVRLTQKYKELGACAKCSVPKNPVKKILCMNCKSPSKANS